MLPLESLATAIPLAGLGIAALAGCVAIGYAFGRRSTARTDVRTSPFRGVAPETAMTVFRELLRNASGPIAVKDLAGRFILVNDRFASIHDRQPDDLAGVAIATLYQAEKVAFFEEQDRRMLALGVTTQNEVRAVHSDGTVMDLLTTRFPIRDDRGEVFAIGTLNTDIGTLKRVEADLRTHRDNLEALIAERTDELRRLNANKDRLFSIVAHDLRGPFNSILGFSAMLAEKSGTLDPGTTARYARLMHESSRSLFDLLNNLLDWSRLQLNELRLDAGPQPVAALVAEAVRQCSLGADEKRIAIRVDVADGLTATADRTALVTVLRNLIGNALKFSVPGADIRIAARCAGDRAVVEVCDAGVGMDAATVASLFDPAHRVTRPGTRDEGGSGLGLQICHELAQRMHGSLDVDSAPGRGTTMRLSLPVPVPQPVPA